MKLPQIWRRTENQATLPAVPTIDIKTPRACWYQTFSATPGPCPQCGAILHQSHQSYVIATRRGHQTADTFCMGGDFGWFCPACPTVVIDPAQVSKMLSYSLPHWDVGTSFAALGIIDLDAIPAEKANVPLGDDDNPIPLVQFTSVNGQQILAPSAPREPRMSRHTGPTRRKSSAKKRRSR